MKNKFNEKYKNYLKEGFYGCDLNNSEALNYLDREFQELIKIPGFKYSQIKQKFDWFCFYADNLPEGKGEEIAAALKKIYNKESYNKTKTHE